MLVPLLAPSWATGASLDVLSMFQAPTNTSGGSSGSGSRRRSRAAVQPLPLPLPAFALPPMPADVLSSLPSAAALPPFDPVAAAAFLLNPMAAAAAATFAAAATMAEQQLEESMADAVSCPAAPAGAVPAVAPGLAATPGAQFKMASALTSHLSDVAGPGDAEMHGECVWVG